MAEQQQDGTIIDRGKVRRLAVIGPDQLRSGWFTDAYTTDVPFWETAENVSFTAHGIKKSPGFVALLTPSGNEPVRGMTTLVDAGIQKLYWGDLSNIYESVASAAPTTEGSGYTGREDATASAIASFWSMQPFGTWVLATNGKDAPQIYKGSGFSNLTTESQFTTCEIFIVKGPHVLALNINGDSRRYYFSDEDDPETWLADTDNAAGSNLIREMSGRIVAAKHLGDKIAVYSKDEMFVITYLGAPNYFGHKFALDGIGAVSKESVVSVGRMNYGLGELGFWVTDGVSSEYIDDPAIREYIHDRIDWDQASKVNAYHDEPNNRIVWYYPVDGAATDEPTEGVAFNYLYKTWALLTGETITSSMEKDVFQYPLLANYAGEIFASNNGQDLDDSTMQASAVTGKHDLGEPDLIKEITAIRVGYEGSNLKYRLKGYDNTEGAALITETGTLSEGFDFTPVRAAGRYITLELYSDEANTDWHVKTIEFHGRLGGTR